MKKLISLLMMMIVLLLTAALAGKMGHAAVTVKGQRFRSMALRISYTIGGEDGEPTAELVAEPLE